MFAYGQTGSGKTHSMQGTRTAAYTVSKSVSFANTSERRSWDVSTWTTALCQCPQLFRDNPGVYTRTFNELFKALVVPRSAFAFLPWLFLHALFANDLRQVAKERTGWKIELKGVRCPGQLCHARVVVAFLSAARPCVEIYNEALKPGLLSVVFKPRPMLGSRSGDSRPSRAR